MVPRTPPAPSSGGNRLGRADPFPLAHPHPESGHPRARPPGRPGLVASATSCWRPGTGRKGSALQRPQLGSVCCFCFWHSAVWVCGEAGMLQAGSRPLSIRSSSPGFPCYLSLPGSPALFPFRVMSLPSPLTHPGTPESRHSFPPLSTRAHQLGTDHEDRGLFATGVSVRPYCGGLGFRNNTRFSLCTPLALSVHI